MTTQASDNHELVAERDRLTERFVLMQSELGGLFYEMAIRDHLQLDLLVERAAAMQRVEDELRRVELQLGKRKPITASLSALCGVMGLEQPDHRGALHQRAQNPIKPVKIVDLVNYWYFERGVTPANKGICFERHRA